MSDRLLAELRGKLDSISNSAEHSRAFKGSGDAAYDVWLKRHWDNGYILHRPTAAAKTASLHLASCPRISVEAGAELAKGPRTGCPTKAAALAFALRSKWKVVTTCDRCDASA